MTDETIFLVANNAVVPAWLLLVLAPRWRWTIRLVHSGLPVALLVPLYAWLIFFDTPGPQGASFFSLQGVMNIFTTPRTVIGCWVHYLVFDLFVGAWISRDAQRLDVPHLLVAPLLVLTLLFGPIGLATYLLLRLAVRRRSTLDEADPRALGRTVGTEPDSPHASPLR